MLVEGEVDHAAVPRPKGISMLSTSPPDEGDSLGLVPSELEVDVDEWLPQLFSSGFDEGLGDGEADEVPLSPFHQSSLDDEGVGEGSLLWSPLPVVVDDSLLCSPLLVVVVAEPDQSLSPDETSLPQGLDEPLDDS